VLCYDIYFISFSFTDGKSNTKCEYLIANTTYNYTCTYLYICISENRCEQRFCQSHRGQSQQRS